MIHRLLAASALLFALALASIAPAADAPDAVIVVTSATAGSSIGQLVQGRMRYRDHDYLLTLRGVATPETSRGSVYGLQKTRDIQGTFRVSGDVLRNASGVTIRFEPPLRVKEDRVEIELEGLMHPKNTPGQGGARPE